MARYIDAEELINNFNKFAPESFHALIIKSLILKQPSADVQEVKHGKWNTDESGVVICSECGEEHEWQDFRPPYCDMCGAKMDKEIELK